ncbi:amidohydrolase family protein [Salinibacter grassmerensis]|uniref:amidohydrolase family protein n=1 Tax=Salinibacter grassmerensis TaxID=3040353 RepID=UPI0021E72E43|nr:amidohydrolase family protein [Salinibacter grassmerensis]
MTASTFRRYGLGLLSLVLLALPSRLSAQDYEVPTVTDTYALQNARVVQAPGQVLESATVVVRDGVIDAVGPDAEVPYDARTIEADSLVVYAGFIDGLSHAGVEMPETEDEDVDDPGNPPPDAAGIQPDRSVRPFLTPDESDLQSLRKAGFTLGHVAPEGQMLPGTSAHVFYGGETANDMVLETAPTLFAQIQTSAGYVYPATDMAVIAQMRQLYREAERRQQLEAAYEQDPAGRPQPPQDPQHSALFSVLDGEQPLAFYADEALSLHRILALHQELDFPLVLAGLGESHEMVSTLQGVDAPLFLTLDLPEAPTRSTGQDTTVVDTTSTPSRYYNPDLRVLSHETVGEEDENLELRHAAERQTYLETAATLHEAGLEFGFTTREADPGDVRDNLRTMIEQGLPEQTALAALTTRPATQLGLNDRLGTVEEGKIANLVVTDGSYFSNDTAVQHVFVDGRLYDYSTDGSDEGEVSGDVSAVLGTWSYTLETPQGDLSGEVAIEGDQSGLDGTFTGPQGDEQPLQSVSFDGTTLSFTVDSPQGGSVSVSVTVEGDTFDGSASTSGGSFPISGERTSTPGTARK